MNQARENGKRSNFGASIFFFLREFFLCYNHGHNHLRIFVLTVFPFTTSETEPDY